VTLTAMLTPETWRVYKDMRDELVVWLQNGNVATSATAAVKALRLSQITGGFLGGVEEANIEPVNNELLESINLGNGYISAAECEEYTKTSLSPMAVDEHIVHEVGREKLDVLLWFIEQRLEADPNLHLVAWGRFRAEVLRAEVEVKRKFPQFETAVIMGWQRKADRLRGLSLLHPETSPKGPVFVAGVIGTGSFGLNMTAAHTCVTLSEVYSPGKMAQTFDRIYGPGMTEPVAFYSIVAVGPKGQRTIDHDVLAARMSGEDVAARTSAAWVKALTEE